MIRFANRYDNDKIMELLRDFCFQSNNPFTKYPHAWSKTYTEQLLNTLYAGKGFVLINEKQTGILIAIKTETFWVKDIYQLQEVMLHSNSKIVMAKLIKEFVKIAKEMLDKHEIHQAVMSSYVGVDLSKFGMKLLEHHWEIS